MNYGSVCDWLIGLGRPKTWLWLWTFAATKSPARHPTIRCVHPNSKWSPCVKPKYIKSSEHIQLIIIVVLILIILRLTWISLFLGWFGIKLINFYPFLIPTYLIKKKKKIIALNFLLLKPSYFILNCTTFEIWFRNFTIALYILRWVILNEKI